MLWTERSPEKVMKKILLSIAFAIVFALAIGTIHHKTIARPTRLTPERSATHQIRYYKKPGEEKGMCTGTAIGPHALLTAGHCNEGEELVQHIQLDYSSHYYKILDIITDGQDHDIYILDGPAFTHYVTVRAREAKIGEKVVSYGTGGNDYPPHTYIGRAEVDVVAPDQSDVDSAEGTHAFSLPVVPGDSGSAIYAEDGSIVALLTWGNSTEGEDAVLEGVGSALDFPPALYEKIQDLKETENNDDTRSGTKH